MATEKRLDLIDRKELVRLYSLWIGQLQAPEDEGDLNGVQSCLAVLEEQPAVDAVEVVRCKDCTKWKEPWLIDQTCGKCTIGKTAITEPTHFCAYGERK